MRLLRIGHAGITLFCGIMDMDMPVAKSYFYELTEKIREASSIVAAYSMNKAATEEKEKTVLRPGYKPRDIVISIDGSWMKRGFSSLFGVVATIGVKIAKVIDISVKIVKPVKFERRNVTLKNIRTSLIPIGLSAIPTMKRAVVEWRSKAFWKFLKGQRA